MTKAQGVLVLMALCGQLGLSYSIATRPPVAAVVAAPTRWAYRIEVVPDLGFNATMTALGADGWALVSARRANSAAPGADVVMAYEAIFQRPIR